MYMHNVRFTYMYTGTVIIQLVIHTVVLLAVVVLHLRYGGGVEGGGGGRGQGIFPLLQGK